jgi:hypothetical protein
MSGSTQAYDKWRRRNPLRQWRQKQWPPISRSAFVHTMAAAGHQVTPITILRWESGEYEPPAAAIAALERITGIAGLSAKWARWQKARQS